MKACCALQLHAWLACLLLSVLSACDGSGEQHAFGGVLRLQARHALGPAYADSSVNVSIFRHSAILRLNRELHVVSYYDPAGDVRVASIDDRGRMLRSLRVTPRLDARLLGDGHCSINLGLAPDGRIVLMYGAHDTRPFYASFDRLQLEDVRVNGEVVATVWPRNISYPQFYRIGNRLEMWFRADPQSEVHRVAYNEVIQAFPLQSELLLTPGTAERVYMNKLAVAGRTLALSWMYRLFSTDDNVRNEGMFVVVSHDGGETWFELAGRPVSLPLTRGDVLPVISLPAESNPLNQTTSAFGPDGRFYMTYYAKDMRGIPQLFLAGFGPDGTLQHDLPMTRNTTPFELFGRGTLVLPLSRPQIVVSEKYAHVIYRAGEQMQVSSLDLALGQRLDSVTRVYSQPLGAWEPAVDDDSWREDGSLWVYLQDARQGPLDAAAPGPTGSASLLVFTED